MKRFLIVMIIFLVCFSTHGRIGETLEQCKERYGEPIQITGDNYYFVKSGFLISIFFYEEKADLIVYCKTEKDIFDKPKEISENEIIILLDSNSNEQKWKEINEISVNKSYQTEDGKLYALYYTFDHMLIISTDKYVERQQAETEKKEKEQMEGL